MPNGIHIMIPLKNIYMHMHKIFIYSKKIKKVCGIVLGIVRINFDAAHSFFREN